MLEIKKGTKKFDALYALNDFSCTVKSGTIFGVVGSNGAGKSTLLRVMSGVYSLDEGTAELNGETIYNNPHAKSELLYLSDTFTCGFGMTIAKLAKEYSSYYPKFDVSEYNELLRIFKLNEHMPMQNFSKGMMRQAMIIIALSCNTKYIVLDETMDGLDPIIRNLVKKKIYQKVADKNTTIIISSHSLKELQDFCDSLVLIHQGKLILSRQIQDMDLGLVKVQAALKEKSETLLSVVDVVTCTKSGSVYSMIVRGGEEEVIAKIQKLNPLLLEVVPLSLEEVFTYELQQLGYAVEQTENSALNVEEK